jgi:urease accessory protein
VCGPVTAAVRLTGLDPFDASGVLARLTRDVSDVAARAAGHAARVPAEGADALPADSAPLLDITAEQHATWPVRLFAS